MKNIKFCFVYVTVENFRQANIISELAIKNKLCACTNIFPEIHSVFEWEGQINFLYIFFNNMYLYALIKYSYFLLTFLFFH